MIILETLRVRPIGDILDGSKAQAIKIDAVFEGNPSPRELAWIKPVLFTRGTGIGPKDREGRNKFSMDLQNRLTGVESRLEAVNIIKNMGLPSFGRILKEMQSASFD